MRRIWKDYYLSPARWPHAEIIILIAYGVYFNTRMYVRFEDGEQDTHIHQHYLEFSYYCIEERKSNFEYGKTNVI